MRDVYRRSFRLPHGHKVTFSYGPEGLQCIAVPWPPVQLSARQRRRLSAAYEAARAEFMSDVATMLGGPVHVLDGKGLHVFTPARRQ